MRPSVRSLLLAACLAAAGLFSGTAGAHDYRAGSVAVGHPFARATLPGATVGGAYMTLRNEGTTADRLVSARTPAARTVSIHAMAMEGDVMRMSPIEGGLEIPPGETVAIEPGGIHLMLEGLTAPLVEGTRVPMSLTFASGARAEVELAVEAPNARAPGAPAGGHDAHAGHAGHSDANGAAATAN